VTCWFVSGGPLPITSSRMGCLLDALERACIALSTSAGSPSSSKIAA